MLDKTFTIIQPRQNFRYLGLAEAVYAEKGITRHVKSLNGPFNEISGLIAYAHMHHINVHTNVSSKAICL